MASSRFDKSIDRTTFPAMKWSKSSLNEHFGNDEVLPFWVADMDFEAPEIVIDSLTERAKHGVYGYGYKKDAYFDALVQWYLKRHGWQIERNHIEACPGVLSAISILINQHSNEGDGIIIQPPVFFEFNMVIKSNNRERVKNPLKLVNGRYEIDFEDLGDKATNPNNKILILCNPHNPVGRVWTKAELTRVAEICKAHDVLVISDEIHGDIVYKPHRYTPFASLSDDLTQKSAICLSAAKTFNIAGMVDAMVVIPDTAIREQFHDFAHRYQINKINVFALVAIESAYRKGSEWLDELLDYLQGNIDFIRSYLAEHIPQVKLIEPEGTYLIWLNFEALGLDAKELAQFLSQDAGIALNSGHWFGREGAGHARMTIACPRSLLQEALEQLKEAVHRL